MKLKYPEHAYAPLWDNYVDFVRLPYLHSSTAVETPTGERPITELLDGDLLLDSEGNEVSLKKIFKIQPKVDYIRFGKGSLQRKEPNAEPKYDLYVSPSTWFLFKHNKAMDCENIMNGNSIARTSIEHPADVFLLTTEKGDYVRCCGIDLATLPHDDLIWWLSSETGGASMHVAQRAPNDVEWISFIRQ